MSARRTRFRKESAPNHAGSAAAINGRLRSPWVENSPDAPIAMTPDGIILCWNAGAESVYDYTRAEAVGKNLHKLVAAPERVEECERVTRRAMESGRAVFETVHRKKDGSAIYVEITANAVRDRRGNLRFVTMCPEDVTQIKVSRHCKMLEGKFLGLLEYVPDAIVIINNTGRIVLVNEQAEGLFGYTKDELLGQPIEVLLPKRFGESHVGQRMQIFSTPKSRTMGSGLELYACRRDGTEFPVEISSSPLHIEEGAFAMNVTLDIMLADMSGRTVLEKLRERGLNQQTPVIVATLLAHKGVIARFQVADILSKPLSQADLLRALEKCGVASSTPRPILVLHDDCGALKPSAVAKKDDQADALVHEIRNILRTPVDFAQHTDE